MGPLEHQDTCPLSANSLFFLFVPDLKKLVLTSFNLGKLILTLIWRIMPLDAHSASSPHTPSALF